MLKKTMIAAATMLSALLVSLAAGAEKESRITQSQLPKEVLNAFQQQYPKAQIKGVAKEIVNDSTYYEIESLDGQTKRDLLYRADGSVYEIEEAIAPAELPKAVHDTLQSRYAGQKVVRAQKNTRNGVSQYEVQLGNNKQLSFDEEGRPVSPQPATGKKDDQGEKHEKKEH